MASLGKLKRQDYASDREKIRLFLVTFTEGSGKKSKMKYMEQLQAVANRTAKTIDVYLDDVNQAMDAVFLNNVLTNTLRYRDMFAEVCDKLMPGPNVDLLEEDVYDVWQHHREERLKAAAAAANGAESENKIPSLLSRRYELRFIPQSLSKALPLREIRASHIGGLVTVKGIVTRITDVQPKIQVAAYICGTCGYESFQTINSTSYLPLTNCPSAVCKMNGTSGKLQAQTRGSKFVRYQELKLQEMPQEVPVGHIPRTLTCRLTGELTRSCTPGNVVTISGVFLPLRFEGFRAMKAGLISDTYLEISSLASHKKSYNDFTFTPELLNEINEKAEEKDVYSQLASSIAPEIYGHEDVKKALLCLLVGGVSRTLGDGMKIRGDINILLMGDPGVAKSQLLKHIAHVAPRGIYTTGKGSSGVGLTAAVLRDVTTGEVTLEGGALVLADQGICCIDEFDKMEDSDRTAIHEVMEQQTVSIAKAGITTTLNARTAVLAAANPVYGRWNRAISAEKNLGIETALLSRFDLTFSLLDTPDEDVDEALARHITHVHRHNKHPALEFEPFAPEFMRAYVCRARQFEPFVPEHLTEHIVSQYVELRKEKGEEGRRTFVTARSLLAVLRLSQALARINFRPEVRREDVEEAQRLMWVAKQTGEDDVKKPAEDPISAIWGLILAAYKALPKGKTAISKLDISNKATARGYSAEQVDETILNYTAAGLIVDSYDSSKILIAAPVVS